MISSAEQDRRRRFRQMGCVFIILAIVFSAGAYFFPVEAPLGIPEWVYMSENEKESFYMVSLIFIAAGIYCMKS